MMSMKPRCIWLPTTSKEEGVRVSQALADAGYQHPDPDVAFFEIEKPTGADVAHLCAEAMRRYEASDFAKAFELAQQAFQQNNRSVDAAKLMAEVILKVGAQRQQAERLLRHALALKPEDPAIHPALAEVCLLGGRLEEAMLWVRQSITRDPKNLRTMRVLAKIHEKSGDLPAAKETLELAVATHTTSLEAKLEYGLLLRKAGQPFEGLQIISQIHGGRTLPLIDPSQRPVRVAFLVQHPQGWTNFESVWQAMSTDPRFEATLVSAPYLHPYPPEGGPEAIYGFLDQRGIKHRKWDSGILRPNFADVLFIQNPYEVTRPAPLRIGPLMKLVPRLAYIPYGLEIGGGEENAAHQYNLPLQQWAWLVCARSPRHKDMFATHCASGNSHLAVTGHPKIDPIKNLPKNIDDEILAFARDRKVFVWNPQFDIRPDGTGFSTFLIWNDFFLKEFQRRQNDCLIIRPHPLFFGTLESRKIWDKQQIERFLHECQNSPNILIDRRPSYHPVFAASSALLSDASSFLLEYAATGKPILYLPNKKGPQLNSDGEFVEKHCQIGETEDQIRRFLDDVAQGKDRNAHSRMEAYKSFMHFSKFGAGHEIKIEILRRLREEFELQNSMPIHDESYRKTT
jgi:hypothetical protein